MIGTCRRHIASLQGGLFAAAQRRRRRLLLLTGLALALAMFAPSPLAASPVVDEGRNAYSVGDGRDAFGLRFGLLCFVGVVLAGGVYAQFQSIATLRRGRPAPGRARQLTAPDDAAAPALSRAPRAFGADTAPTNDWAPLAPASTAPPALPRNVASLPPAAPAGRSASPQASLVAEPRDLAAQDCLRAIAAACRYDRHTTLAAFRSALARNPEVKPSSLPGFWDMPSGGHADLARAYLLCGQHLDARSILTVAMMLSPHNRELEALAREGSPPALPAFPLRSQG